MKDCVKSEGRKSGLQIAESSPGRATEAVMAWAAPSALKDADGHPTLLFHGTNASFDDLAPSAEGILGAGIYLIDDPVAAEEFTYRDKAGGENIIAAYARLERPYIHRHSRNAGSDPGIAILRDVIGHEATLAIEAEMEHRGTEVFGPELQGALSSLGHDGIIVIYGDRAAWPGAREIVAFDAAQVLPAYCAAATLARRENSQAMTGAAAATRGLIAYHATDCEAEITQFRAPSYFTNDPDFATAFGRRALYTVELSMTRPYLVDGVAEGRHFEWDDEDVARLKAEGFDGVAVRHPDGDVYMPLDPGQVRVITRIALSPQKPVTASLLRV